MKQYKIAITGGIGSGKSTVLKILNNLGYKTVSFDKVYNDLLKDGDFVLCLSNMFEIEPIKKDGHIELDKISLSNKVFNDKNLLDKLNNFTHKKIFQKAFSLYDDKIVFYEVPLLFEGHYESLFDKVLVVARNKEDRIVSAIKRDKISKEQIENKLKNQINYDNYDFSLHTIIQNDGDFSSLEKSVLKVVEEIKLENI